MSATAPWWRRALPDIRYSDSVRCKRVTCGRDGPARNFQRTRGARGLYERTSGAAGQPLGSYQRRAPERTVLHQLVARHAQSMLSELRDADPDGGGLPRYVERELAAYLRCGILAHGFTRVRCQTCHDEIVVAFSGKRRGLCPSCTSRRMADTAAHLVDRVPTRGALPPVGLHRAQAAAARARPQPRLDAVDRALVVRAIGAWQRRVARNRGLPTPRAGAVTFVQRFGGLVNLNVHFHLVVPDGVFVDGDAGLRFEMAVPTNTDVLAILDRLLRRIARRLAMHANADDVDEDARPDVLAQVQADAATTWSSSTEARATVRGVERLRAWCVTRHSRSLQPVSSSPRTNVPALERLCRYGARPAFAQERLAWTADASRTRR